MYGLMSERLSKYYLWPLPKTKNYNSTPAELCRTIIHALDLSLVAHKPMRMIHNGDDCSSMDDWGIEFQHKLKYGLRKYMIDRRAKLKITNLKSL